MKKFFTIAISLILIAIMICVVSSCGKDNGDDTTKGSEDTSSQTEQQPDTKPSGSDYDCDNGKHKWGTWVYTDPTCTTAGTATRTCDLCGKRQSDAEGGSPATGHSWSDWEVGVMCDQRQCSVCGATEEKKYTNVANKSTVTVTGDWYGAYNKGILIDNNWYNPGSMAPKGSSSVECLLEFNEDTYIDQIAIGGRGGTGYEVYVLYADGADYEFLGSGAFSSHPADELSNAEKANECKQNAQKFEVGREVVAIKIVMASPSQGTSFWDEVQCGVKPQ